MSDIKSQHEIDEMRKRLYSRGFDDASLQRHDLSDRKIDVARNWGTPTPIAEPPVQVTQVQVQVQDEVIEHSDSEIPTKHGYRKFVLIGSFVIFALVASVAGAFVYLGTNKISADNINLNISGPATIGGSETISFQIGITNQNTVAIDSAVLVVKYPSGTRTVSDPIKNVYEERINVGTLNPTEAKNIPIQVAIYGKENESKQIDATLEYRIVSSDGTFYKVAEPLRFQIISSPIILQVSSLRKVSAGQEVEVTLTAKSNTEKVLKDILISASYPTGFVYNSSSPDPIYNENTWMIEELKPEESAVIKLKGTIAGLTEETSVINFSAGASESDNQFIVGSLLAEARTEFYIERPFITVDLTIEGDADRSVVLEQGLTSQVGINIKNTLDESVYDMVVEVVPSGNALGSESIESSEGYYDSNKGVVRWEVANNPDLAQLLPGASRMLQFSILPDKNRRAASFDITVNVYARRVAERSAQEQLIGTVKATAKYSSSALLTSKVKPQSGPFPPKVGETSNYQVTLVASAGSNDMTNATVKTSLPSHMTWTNEYSGSGAMYFNPVTKQIEWNVGDIDSQSTKEMVFTVGILPSLSQVGITPILVNRQTLESTDRFTGTTLSAISDQLNTELPLESGYEEGNGIVTQ
jgi:hypothetical protein